MITKTAFVFYGLFVLLKVLLYAHWVKKSIVNQLSAECLRINNQTLLHERLITDLTDDQRESEDLEDTAGA